MLTSLSPGEAIAVVAPGSRPDPDRFARGLELLQARYRVAQCYAPLAAHLASPENLADTDDARAEAINRALVDESVRAIVCARGGYGCARILSRIDKQAFVERRIPLVGFSDVTALHAWALRLGIPTIHGPVVTQLGDLPTADRLALFELLESQHTQDIDGLYPLGETAAQNAAPIGGTLVGGNLTLLASLCGTRYALRQEDSILLLEDVGEAPYRISRSLTQLQQSGSLVGVRAVVTGDFSHCGEHWREVLIRFFTALRLPVFAGVPVGHGQRNLALPLGAPARLDPQRGRLAVCLKGRVA